MMIGMFLGAVWVETTPQDFLDGWVDPLLYVSRRLSLETSPSDSGAVEFAARFDVDRNGYYDLVSSGSVDRNSSDQDSNRVLVWLGSDTGYNQAVRIEFELGGGLGGNVDVADLNGDDWPEIIHSGWDGSPLTIYWGPGKHISGFPSSGCDSITTLPNLHGEAVYIADLNEDTYLDILIAGDYDYGGELRVYWGGPGGYSASNYTDFGHSPVGHNLEVADLDQDGVLDIVMPVTNGVLVVYGQLSGGSWAERNTTFLEVDNAWYETVYPHGITLADLNNDGILDIAANTYGTNWGQIKEDFYVWWGQPGGTYSDGSRLKLSPGPGYGGSSAWDLNGDGWLDLVLFRGFNRQADPGDEVLRPLVLYNTGSPPYFSLSNSEEIGPYLRASGGFIGDFNNDGNPDIFVNVGAWSNYYRYGSVVLWGPTWDSSTATAFPYITCDHHGGFREGGNIWNRGTSARYVSGVFQSDTAWGKVSLSWLAGEPGGSQVMMEVMAWDTNGNQTPWLPIDNGDTLEVLSYLPQGYLFLRYRATLSWQNPAYLPHLERVEITTLDPILPVGTNERVQGRPAWLSVPGGIALFGPARLSVFSADGRAVFSGEVKGRVFLPVRPGVYVIYDGRRTHKLLVR